MQDSQGSEKCNPISAPVSSSLHYFLQKDPHERIKKLASFEGADIAKTRVLLSLWS